MEIWGSRFDGNSWKEFLKEGLAASDRDHIRMATRTGRPLGTDDFVRQLEKQTGRFAAPAEAGSEIPALYVHLVDTKFTKWSNFVREAWLIKEKWNKRSCLKSPLNADARRCSAPLIGVDRRPSAVSYPRRYEVARY